MGADVQVESCRLVLIQVLLKDFKMDPLASIALYAPVCLQRVQFDRVKADHSYASV